MKQTEEGSFFISYMISTKMHHTPTYTSEYTQKSYWFALIAFSSSLKLMNQALI